MSDPPTPLTFPTTLPFPIKITRLIAHAGDTVSRGSSLLEYAFTSDESRRALTSGRGKEDEEIEEWDLVGVYESPIEGEVEGWDGDISPGKVVERRHASRPLIIIQQPCSHPVQLHGMCGICGRDLTEDDYLSRPVETPSQAGPSRHAGGYEMSHDATGVTVSTQEAQRLENQTRDTLLASRKLSLIVDLDQTIIHTTVDPTVGEWMAEIEEDERQEQPAVPVDGSTTPPSTPPRPRKPSRPPNPNAEALKDVARFQLPDDLPPGYQAPPGSAVNKAPIGSDRWYYTKPRPGLGAFMKAMSALYEMHVYTMGTRTYADAIVNIVDPDGTFFGGRILSRDESGSFSSKSLKRLFPTDQSMVVVIDDRSDVWGDCPNLVKVIPYDFFVGIGDINGTFLPPTAPIPIPSPNQGAPQSSPSDATSEASTPPPATPPLSSSSPEGLLAQSKLLDEVSESRPLAKMQEQLEQEEASGAADSTDIQADVENVDPTPISEHDGKTEPTTPPGSPHRARKPLLNPHDHELERVANILSTVHVNFYSAYDHRQNRGYTAKLPLRCDVEMIVPEIKEQVLAGTYIVFSGLIPKHIKPETSEIWTTAEAFGAIPQADLMPSTTHLVAAHNGTEKAVRASRRANCVVVWPDWFFHSVQLWKRQKESDYLAMPAFRSPPKIAQPTNEVEDEDVTDDIEAEADEPEAEEDPDFGEFAWDDEADKELGDFLDGSSDVDFTEDGRSITSREGSPSSIPGTPSKKRVRYADEESLPLESFKDPSPEDRSESPQKKKRKPLLLELPGPDDFIPEANRFVYEGRNRDAPSLAGTERSGNEEAVGKGDADGVAESTREGGSEEGDEDEDDEFAKMLAESLAEES
ncbi:hypothetical protein BCR39DRAFT_535875 [Naematelia encephala]|uniref:RNA polymerase II subunit A C-terminal domain phosphatase n=1 Tax=Naematelia encephala TaxID=71784 RepID=A0A1Y2B031_9TREE|nr:hypothetical protein BCR39DRAFT_535875 [Naematelia encephala]